MSYHASELTHVRETFTITKLASLPASQKFPSLAKAACGTKTYSTLTDVKPALTN
jgi:hypothetical protein